MEIDWKALNTTGARIKFFREQARWSQERLADETGISRNSIALYETNKRNPPIKQLKTIAFVLDINVLYLNPEFDQAIENAQEQEFSAQNEYFAATTLEKLFLTKFRNLTEKQQLDLILTMDNNIQDNLNIMARQVGIAEKKGSYNTNRMKLDDK